MENCIRDALRNIAKRLELDYSVSLCEARVTDSSGREHRVDALVENASHRVLIHSKSTQLISQGYSRLYMAETAWTSLQLQGENIRAMTVFVGDAFSPFLAKNDGPFIFVPGYYELAQEQAVAILEVKLLECGVLDDFRRQQAPGD